MWENERLEGAVVIMNKQRKMHSSQRQTYEDHSISTNEKHLYCPFGGPNDHLLATLIIRAIAATVFSTFLRRYRFLHVPQDNVQMLIERVKLTAQLAVAAALHVNTLVKGETNQI